MTTTPKYKTRTTYSKRNLLSGVLFGIGLAAFIDETVFHQLLHWHHFYDKSTTSVGLVSDGLFHAFSWFATIWAGFLFSDLRRRNALVIKVWAAGLLLGAGGFQFYDGTLQHKIMRIHQIRYNVDIFPYDLTWNIIAAVMILSGAYLLLRSQQKARYEGGPAN
ncbi:MAG: DUF2243 domain-containing protein [Neobacillus sp.]